METQQQQESNQQQQIITENDDDSRITRVDTYEESSAERAKERLENARRAQQESGAFSTIWQKTKIAVGEYYEILGKNPGYRWLWLSAMISTLGMWFSLIAVISIIAGGDSEGGHSGGLAVSLIYVSEWLPPVLLMPFTGVISDFFDRRKIMMVSDIVRAGLILLQIVAQYFPQHIWLVYLVSASISGFTSMFDVSREGLIPLLVREDQLHMSNALDSITWMTATFVGSSLGGFVTSYFGTTVNFCLDSVSFLVSGFFVAQLLRVKIDMSKDPHGAAAAASTNSEETLEGSAATVAAPEAATAEQELQEDKQQLNQKQQQSVMYTEEESPADSKAQDLEQQAESILPHQQQQDDSPSAAADEPTEPSSVIESTSTTDNNKKRQREPIGVILLNFVKKVLRYFVEFFIGLKFLITHPYLLTLTIMRGSGAFAWLALEITNVQFITNHKINDDFSSTLGVVKALSGLSSGITPICIQRIVSVSNAKAMRLIIVLAFVAITGGYVIMYFSTNIWMYCIGTLAVGCGGGAIWVQSTTMIQQVAPNEFMGRTFSIDFGFFFPLCSVVSVVGSGLLADYVHLGYHNLLLVFLVYCTVSVIWWTLWAALFSKRANTKIKV